MKHLTFIITLLLWFVPVAQAASIYVYVNAKGNKLITDHPRSDLRGYKLQKTYGVDDNFGLADRPASSTRAWRARSSDYDDLIVRKAQSLGLEAALLKAIVHVESAFNPVAVSPKGATGLMQLMPATAQRYGVVSRTDPAASLDGGGRYLRDLLQMFDFDLRLALAAYNAGEGAVMRYNGIPPYPETQGYVENVIRMLDAYRRNLAGA